MNTEQQLTRTSLIWQLLSVVIVLLPHLGHLPLWVPALVLLCLIWRYFVHLGRLSFPPKLLRAGLVVVAAVGVLASYRTGGGISVTVTLLVVAFGLKTLEMYKSRDALVVLYVSYLVASTAFLFDQSMAMALYVLFALSVTTTALLTIYQTANSSFWQPYRRTVTLLLPALPLMAVLFIVMPRIGPLWEVGLDQSAAKTGLAEEMSPGDISHLTRSAEVAFRVSFQESVPPQSKLYWRAMVLNDFDGQRWFNNPELMQIEKRGLPNTRATASRKAYELILEPSQRTYVPVLEQVVTWPQPLRMREDNSLVAPTEQTLRKQYQLTSIMEQPVDAELTRRDLRRQLSLPEGNPRARRQALSWWQSTQSVDAYLEKILQFYNQSFVYSLTPPRLSGNTIDAFLFDTQTGFCGHFAGATVFMLRAVGIPARIVTGYQGGEWNHFEKYLLVRQYDAHAWIEVWKPGLGWQRVDPTASVAPERIRQPADEAFSSDESFLSENPMIRLGIRSSGFIAQLRLRMEAFNYGWHRWVLNYHHQQNSLLKSLLGEISILKIVLFLLLPFALVIAVTLIIMLRANRPKAKDECDQLINKISESFSKQGLQRSKGEPFQSYCVRLADVRPELQPGLEQLSQLYEAIRYGHDDNVQQRQDFRRLVSAFIKTV